MKIMAAVFDLKEAHIHGDTKSRPGYFWHLQFMDIILMTHFKHIFIASWTDA